MVILSSSLSAELKGEIETFPGRRGHGRDYLMYPMCFREFLKVYDESLYKRIGTIKELTPENIVNHALQHAHLLSRLLDAFEVFLECGGFPRAIIELLTSGKVGIEIYEDYLRWIRGTWHCLEEAGTSPRES